jgi:hypothetical protein
MGSKLALVPPQTRVEQNGEGQKFEVSSSPTRTFLCTLLITDVIEQESLDVAIWGSADGENWGTKPLLMLPQRFYRGETRMVLDLTLQPEVKFIRAAWVLNRWGRVAPVPRFVFGLTIEEIPPLSRQRSQQAAVVKS